MKTRNTFLLGATVVGLLLCGGVAQAQQYNDRGETITVPGTRIYRDYESGTASARVSYSDLDLSRMRDYRRLENRIERTAFRVCDVVKGPERWTLNEQMTCTSAAVRDAMTQVPRSSAHRVAYVAQTPAPIL